MKTTSSRIAGAKLSLLGQRSNRMLWTLIGMLVVATALSLPAHTALTSAGGLVGHWNFDEGSGPVAADSSGYGNDGRLADGTVWLQDQARPPFVLFFDGVNNHVNVGNSPSLNPSDEITLVAWVAPYDLSASGEIIAKSNGTDPQYYLRVQAGGKIRFGIGATVLNGNTTLSPSQWHLVAGTYDGATMKIYVDGVLDTVMNKNGPMHDNGVDVSIGCRRFRTLLAFHGLIDDPQIYSRALSANEIQALATPGQVVITSPANGQTFTFEWWSGESSASVGLTADVFNFFAPVSKVDFYEVDYLIGTATQAPYSVLYQYASVGQHWIVAVATDTLGNTVSSDPYAFSFYVCGEYQEPYLRITSPARGQVFAYGDPIYISTYDFRDDCGAWIGGGIDLYLDGLFQVHLDWPNAWEFVWQNAPLGLHSILARSTSNDWLEDSLGITVLASRAPTVSITGPTYGTVFTEPADVQVHVTAQDADGTVVQIQLADGTRTFTSTGTDFDYTFASLAAGNYTLTATATDNTGVTASSSIYVMVLPANDNFADSFDLAQITTGNNANATREPGEPPSHSQYGSNGHSVWWHWTAPSDGSVVITTEGSSFATALAIYTGSTVDNLHLITWGNVPPNINSPTAIAQFFATAGTTYQIAVDGVSYYAGGDIQLNVRYGVLPTVAITSPTDGAWFTAPADVRVHVTAQGAVVQIQLTDGTTTFTTTATDFDYTFPSLAAQGYPYTLTATATDNFGATDTSIIHVTVIARPPNDDFVNSFDLAQITTGNNVYATREAGEPSSYGLGRSVWWHYTAPSDGTAVFSTVGSSFPTGMAIYTGNSLDNLSLVTWYYDLDNRRPAIVAFNLIAGTTYQIAVDGFYDGVPWGDIQLNVRYDVSGGVPRPANDDFANSFDLAQITTGNNVNATPEWGEPSSHNPDGGFADHSVWWHWTAPNNGWVVISTAGSSFDTVMASYTGSSVANLTLIAWNNNSDSAQAAILRFWAIAGTTYQIAVDGVPGAWGDIQLNIRINVAPTVSLTSPANGDSFVFGTPIHLTAIASDSDGFVSEVGFEIDGGAQRFRVYASPYEVDWTPQTRGHYLVEAYAIDNAGVLSGSPTFAIFVQ